MIQEILQLIAGLNSLSPLAIIGLLVTVLFYQAKNNKNAVIHTDALNTIKGNDLHDLPELVETSRQILATLQRMEVSNATNFATVGAKISNMIQCPILAAENIRKT